MIQKTCADCGKHWEVQIDTGSPYCRSCARKHAVMKQRNCEFCGLPFTPASNRQRYCNREHKRVCPICGKEYIEDNVENLKRPPVACSYDCRAKKTRQTSLDKYGCPAPGNAAFARNKSKNTMQSKFGVDYTLQSPELKAQMYDTMIKKYGHTNPAQIPEFLAARLETNMEKYGTYFGPMLSRTSKINEQFSELLTANNIDHECEFRVEAKIFDFKAGNTLIEIDPTFTHTCVQLAHYAPTPKMYHKDKSELATTHGYRCIHIFDWDDKSKIVDMLLPKQHIYARNCTVFKLKVDVANEFLQKHHLQGTCRGQLLCLGLVYQGELYQVMTFGKSRYDKTHAVELLRLCTKPGYTVVGGASKLFKFATQDYGLHDIISYCDRSKFNGEVYEKLGMKFLRCTSPQEVWSKGNKKVTANLLRQRGYDQLFGTNYGKGSSNEQLMLDNGWLPVYDCGQNVYEFK